MFETGINWTDVCFGVVIGMFIVVWAIYIRDWYLNRKKWWR